MLPPTGNENKPNHVSTVCSTQNGDQTSQQNHAEEGRGNRKMSDDRWDQQRSRIDGLLSTLKQEMQEVKVMDKNLTRQFIQLGGKIQKIKEDEKQFFEQLSIHGQSFFEEEEDINIANENGTSVTVAQDTRL